MNNSSTANACVVCGHGLVGELSAVGCDAPCSRCGHSVWFRIQSFRDPVVVELLPSVGSEYANVSLLAQWLVSHGTSGRILLNLSAVRLASSEIIARLIALQKKVRAANVRLVLCGLHPVIRESLGVMRIEDWFDYDDHVEEGQSKA